MKNNFDLKGYLRHGNKLLCEDMNDVDALLQKWKDDPTSDPEYKMNAGDYNQAQADAEDFYDEYLEDEEGRLGDWANSTEEEIADELSLYGQDNPEEVAKFIVQLINKNK